MARVTAKMKWTDGGWESIRRRINAGPAANHVIVGVVGPEGEAEHGDSDLTVQEVAILNEFGSDDGHTPERSFIRRTLIWGNRKMVLHYLAQASIAVTFRKATWAEALRPVGQWGVDAVRKTIASGVGPANAPATIEKKGHGLTLRESFLLAASIGYEIAGPNSGGSGGGSEDGNG